MSAYLKEFLQRLKSLRWPPAITLTRLLPLIVLAVALTGLSMLLLWRSEGHYKPLFGSREEVSAADSISVLDAQGIPYRIHPQSGQLLVPADQLGEARMQLAAKGVVAKLPEGLESVDKSDPLGVSQFVQDVRFRRGLEGELTKSMLSLDPVAAARVHLSIAKSTSFILGDGEKSSASVVLTLKPQRSLSKAQINAIIGMVAGSVSNLEPARVQLLDQHGNHLSAQVDPESTNQGDDELGMHTRQIALGNINDLLLPSIGAEHYKASVAVDVAQDRIDEMHEEYGDRPLITQEATREEQDHGDIALGVPGSLSNRPVPKTKPDAEADKPEGPRSQRNALTRQYVYDRNVTQIKRAPARVERMSVAVVLDNAAAPDGKQWSTEQLTHVEAILAAGIGIDRARNDQLSVSAMDFHLPAAAPALPWWQQREHQMTLAIYAALALLAFLLIVLVLRPLANGARSWIEHRAALPALLAQQEAEAAAVMAKAEVIEEEEVELEPEIVLPPIGSSADVLIEHLKLLSTQAPERVADVIKPWIRKHV